MAGSGQAYLARDSRRGPGVWVTDEDLLASFCADLGLMWRQAGGPSLRALERRLGRGKSQLGAILSGRVRRVPDWQVVAGLVKNITEYAAERDRTSRLSLPSGITEYWRPRFALLEYAFSHGAAASRSGGDHVIPRELPPELYGFVGRDRELADLDALAGGARSAPGIAVVCGTGGVGKTVLAVRWSRQHTDRFPDGQLYVNLRGFDPSGSAADPATTLRGFLEALGTPAERIPAGLDARSALYRSVLSGRRMLVVLDNASDAAQVRPLLPASAGCAAVITSRDQLTSLVVTEGARLVRLDLFDPGDARALLTARLGAERIGREPTAVNDIIRRCVGLPLALAIVAARAGTHPGLSLAAFADQMERAGSALDVLTGGEPVTDLRAVFSWSYDTLSPDAARLFRLLGLHPGPDVSLAAVSSLVGMPSSRVQLLLAELTRNELLAQDTSGRYRFHDLLRAYAIEQAEARENDDSRTAAVHRLLDHYVHTAHAAALLQNPQRDPQPIATTQPGVEPEPVADHDSALTWFNAERAVLLATIELATATGFDAHVWQLAWALITFLQRQGHWEELAKVQQSALAAAQRIGDRNGQARTLRGLAKARLRLGRPDEADTHYRQALALFTELDDLASQANTHLGLAEVADLRSDPAQVLDHSQRALRLYHASGHRPGQANALNSVGLGHALRGNFRQAISAYRRALALLRELDHPDGEAGVWHSLGAAHHGLAEYGQAAECYQHAIDLCRRIGDRYHEAETLADLGDTYHANGSTNAARTAWNQALDILEEFDHPRADQVRALLY